MSNKIVPTVYRQIIDDVIDSIKVDFDEYGMEEDVLINLQAKWEAKLLETRVADFARAPGASGSPEPEDHPPSGRPPPALHSSPAGPSNQRQYQYAPTSQGLALPGPRMNTGAGPSNLGMGNGIGSSNFGQRDDVRIKTEVEDVLRVRGGMAQDDSDDDLKQSVKPEPNAAGLLPGDDIIDSDLDDSDDELKDGEEDGEEGGEVDIVFCVYDKVQRVKNKWKTTFKDGMIHINGRDYLFAKCNGEFEW